MVAEDLELAISEAREPLSGLTPGPHEIVEATERGYHAGGRGTNGCEYWMSPKCSWLCIADVDFMYPHGDWIPRKWVTDANATMELVEEMYAAVGWDYFSVLMRDWLIKHFSKIAPSPMHVRHAMSEVYLEWFHKRKVIVEAKEMCTCGYVIAEQCPRCKQMRCKQCKKPTKVLGTFPHSREYKPCTCRTIETVNRR